MQADAEDGPAVLLLRGVVGGYADVVGEPYPVGPRDAVQLLVQGPDALLDQGEHIVVLPGGPDHLAVQHLIEAGTAPQTLQCCGLLLGDRPLHHVGPHGAGAEVVPPLVEDDNGALLGGHGFHALNLSRTPPSFSPIEAPGAVCWAS